MLEIEQYRYFTHLPWYSEIVHNLPKLSAAKKHVGIWALGFIHHARNAVVYANPLN